MTVTGKMVLAFTAGVVVAGGVAVLAREAELRRLRSSLASAGTVLPSQLTGIAGSTSTA